jgi:hypothetical protein
MSCSWGKMTGKDYFIWGCLLVWAFLSLYGPAREAGFLSDFFGYPVAVEESCDGQ